MAAESMVFWELSILVLDFFLLLLLQQRGVQAENYVVGGHSVKWALPQMTGHNVSFYSAWAADKKFQLGDNLVFEFPTGGHDVLQLRNFADFNACNTNNAISIHYTGHTVIPLLTMGSLYFIGGIPGHCLQGMKLEVIVMEAAGTSPKTAANSSSFSQGPSPPSNVPVDISSPHQGNVAILQPVTVLLSTMASLLGCVALLFSF